MNLFDILDRSYTERKRKDLLIIAEKTYSYEDIRQRSLSLASQLAEEGVKNGTRVLVEAASTVDTVSSIFACARIGAIFVPISTVVSERRSNSIIANCQPDIMIVHRENGLDLKKIRPDGREPSPKLPTAPKVDDIASIIYTSGSTGTPKGVTMTHRNMLFAANSIRDYLGMNEEDVILNCLPLSFDYGLYQVILTVLSGGTLVLEPSFIYLHNILKKIEKHRVTGWPVVPAMLEMLFKMDLNKYSLSSVRFITNTAQAIPVESIGRFRNLFPDIRIFSMYGLTECKRATYLDPVKIDIKPDSVGKAIPGTEVFLLNDDLELIDEPGKKGVLAIRGPHVMVGYWKDEEETKRKIMVHEELGRVLISEDIFQMDNDGDLYFKGREDDMVKIGGEKASPFEVESVINEVPGVKDSIVFPVKDVIMGNRFHCLVNSENVSAREIEQHCKRSLERYLVPKNIRFVEGFPLLPNGKKDRKTAIMKNSGGDDE